MLLMISSVIGLGAVTVALLWHVLPAHVREDEHWYQLIVLGTALGVAESVLLWACVVLVTTGTDRKRSTGTVE